MVPNPISSSAFPCQPYDPASLEPATKTAGTMPGHAHGEACNPLSGLLHKFLNWLTGKFGESLGPKDVAIYLDAVFKAPPWEKKTHGISGGTGPDGSALENRKVTYRIRDAEPLTHFEGAANVELRVTPATVRNNHLEPEADIEPDFEADFEADFEPGIGPESITHIVANPCHDLPANASARLRNQSAESSVAECLAAICLHHPENTVVVQIPVCQDNPLGINRRGHFALLNARIENGCLKTAVLVDSKAGLLDLFYDGARHLSDQSREVPEVRIDAPDTFEIRTQYLGDQALINGTDCGRFAVKHAESFTNSDTSTYQPIAQEDFLNWCRAIDIDVKETREELREEIKAEQDEKYGDKTGAGSSFETVSISDDPNTPQEPSDADDITSDFVDVKPGPKDLHTDFV